MTTRCSRCRSSGSSMTARIAAPPRSRCAASPGRDAREPLPRPREAGGRRARPPMNLLRQTGPPPAAFPTTARPAPNCLPTPPRRSSWTRPSAALSARSRPLSCLATTRSLITRSPSSARALHAMVAHWGRPHNRQSFHAGGSDDDALQQRISGPRDQQRRRIR